MPEEGEDEGEAEEEEVHRAPNSVLETSTDGQVQMNGSTADGCLQQALNGHKRKKDEGSEQLEAQARTRDEEEEDKDTIACPICMEPWTNSGDHGICSLACGHLFGRSCIVRWLQRDGTRKLGGKCPQCNKKAKKEDLRPLFVPRVVAVADNEGQKLGNEVRHLRSENNWLKAENAKLQKHIEEYKHEEKMALAGHSTLQSFNRPPRTPATTNFEVGSYRLAGSEPRRSGVVVAPSRTSRFWPVDDPQSRSSQPINNSVAWGTSRWGNTGSDPRLASDALQSAGGLEDRFVCQSEVPLLGGKVFDMDADSQTMMFSNKINGGGGSRFGLCKMSLLDCTEIEQIDLPSDLGAIRDIRLSNNSGFGGSGRLALVASIGRRRLSVVSVETNNIVHSYPVHSPPWSCSWDPYIPHILYSGLQDGSVMVLDLRQTSTPLREMQGCSNRPIHTLHVLPDQNGPSRTGAGDSVLRNREFLSASVDGVFHWGLSIFDSASSSSASGQSCTSLTHDSAMEKFCTSLAYDDAMDTAVASFRQAPPLAPNDPSSTGQSSSQIFEGPSASTPSLAAIAQEDPSHWIFRRCLGINNPRGSRMGEVSSSNSSSSTGDAASWRWTGGMSGHKSQTTMMPRGAIVTKWRAPPGSKAWFAGGDEGTNAVWLWDMDTFQHTQTLLPHQSPVLDIKHVHMHGKDVLGCLSDRMFQLYRRQPRSC